MDPEVQQRVPEPTGFVYGLEKRELAWGTWKDFEGDKTLFARSFSEPGHVDWEVAIREPGDSSHPEELPRVLFEFETKSFAEHPDGSHTMGVALQVIKASAKAPWMDTELLRRVQDFVATVTIQEGLGVKGQQPPPGKGGMLNGFDSWRR